LQQPLPKSGTLALKALLAQARQASYRAYANGAPFETKDALKARAYRWDGDKRCWHKTVTGPVSLKEETEWLKTEVYGGRSAKLEIEEFDSKTRFSSRSGNRMMQEI